METESRKRRREPETTERLEHDRLMKKLDVEKSIGDGCCGGEEKDGEEEETGRGVFDFPWLKGEGEGGGGGVMSEEEWKAAAAEDTFLGSLRRCCCEREELEMEGGLRLPLLEDTYTSTSISTTLSLVEELEDGVSLEEAWDRDDIWTSLLH